MGYKATYRTRAYKLRRGGTARTAAVPSMRQEKMLQEKGAELICGVDEVGVGAWAGPVVVAAVVLAPGRRIYKVRDSKLLDADRRHFLAARVREQALSWAVGVSWPVEIDRLGLSEAMRRAADAALNGLAVTPDAALLDGNWNYLKRPAGDGVNEPSPGLLTPQQIASAPGFEGPVRTVVRGDCESVSIACASVVAKVFRDDLMRRMAAMFQSYRFELNKGYPSPAHKWALSAFGPSPVHRRLFYPIRRLLDEGVPGRLLPAAETHP